MRPLFHPRLVNDPFGDAGLIVEFLYEPRALLFDLGDLAPLPPRVLLRVDAAFVSHAHMDHFGGFDRLLRVHLGRDETIGLYGPAAFIERVYHKLQGYTWNLIRNYPGNLVFRVTEIGESGPAAVAMFQSRNAFERESLPVPQSPGNGVVVEEEGFRVRATVLDHATPCLAFALEEKEHINVHRNRLAEAGLPVGPWLRDLKTAVRRGAADAEPITVRWREDGHWHETAVPLGALRGTLSTVPGQKIAYVVDARFTEENMQRLESLIAGADVAYIESCFLDADAALAAHRCHLTARQAGIIARRAGARRLVPFHFSPRYGGRAEQLIAEALAAFAGG